MAGLARFMPGAGASYSASDVIDYLPARPAIWTIAPGAFGVILRASRSGSPGREGGAQAGPMPTTLPFRLQACHFRDLAVRGARVPIATDLVLQERGDPEATRRDGKALAGVVREAAERHRTSLAIPLMDLRLEKADLVALACGTPCDDEAFHFAEPPGERELQRLRAGAASPFLPLQRAHFEAIAEVAGHGGLVPLGMAIGPFSLATKLLADPITAVGLAGRGLGPRDDPAVEAIECCLALAELAVERSLREQLAAGAAAVIVCEPAAGSVYVSPRQMAAGSPVFERFVVEPLVRVRSLLEAHGARLVLHDCGELSTTILEALAGRVRPAVLSLGSSRCLWQDAAHVPEDVVLFGNLPSKHFYSDATLPVERVRALTRELVSRMRETGHPFILGSECDVLDVPGAGAAIRAKVQAFLTEPA